MLIVLSVLWDPCLIQSEQEKSIQGILNFFSVENISIMELRRLFPYLKNSLATINIKGVSLPLTPVFTQVANIDKPYILTLPSAEEYY